LDSTVDVPEAPSGRFRWAHTAPTLSASAISAPPCSAPPAVHACGDQAGVPTVRSAPASVSSMPSPAANGMAASSSAGSERDGMAYRLSWESGRSGSVPAGAGRAEP
jgi:hypothetical protein